MRITLVQPPSNYEETFLLSPPLGLLSIGAAAENEGAQVTLLDFNLKGLQDQRWQTAEYFYPHAVELIEQQKPDMVGFTSMAIESHVCLELARQLKERNPGIITLFGGPHFGAITTEVLERYDWCDFVITGEGETPIQNLIRYIEGNHHAISLENIGYRIGKEIKFLKKTKSGRDLDDLPFPAYHLVDVKDYFSLNSNKLACFEHARGCQLKCSFCYSPGHWGHGESRKSNERILCELRILYKLGFREIFFVSDNFLNSQTRSIDLCKLIENIEVKFTWHCYGTLQQINHATTNALAKSGCKSIFVGVDAVTSENKKLYKKSYFKGWNRLKAKLELCLKKNIVPTCAFMLSPEDSPQSTEEILRIAVMCASLGCFVRLNAITYYNGLELSKDIPSKVTGYSEAYSEILFDTAQLLVQNDFAKENPELFPFHACLNKTKSHIVFARFCRLAMSVVNKHSILSKRSFIDYEIPIYHLIFTLAHHFSENEINCHNIESISTQKKYQELVYFYFLSLGAPTIFIEIDAFIQKNTIKKATLRKLTTTLAPDDPQRNIDHNFYIYDYSGTIDLLSLNSDIKSTNLSKHKDFLILSNGNSIDIIEKKTPFHSQLFCKHSS